MSDLASGYCAVSVISGSLRLSDHRGRPPFHCADVASCVSVCVSSSWIYEAWLVRDILRRRLSILKGGTFTSILKLFLLLFICTYCWLLLLLIHLKRCS